MNVHIAEKWDHFLDRFGEDEKDIYYTEGYVKLYETDIDKAMCIVCESENSIALMPFLRRKIGAYYDFETAYGYGGPIFHADSEDWIREALGAMKQYFTEQKYLCGFMRFHPILGNAEACKVGIPVFSDRKTIRIDLTEKNDDIWMNQITSKNRNMIRKAEKQGVEFCAEYDYAAMTDFIALYRSTMERLQAEEFYFFSDDYFAEYKKNMQNKGFLGRVCLNGKTIGAALFMTCGPYGHYHLAGSDRNYSSLGINNFLLWTAALEMKKQGIRSFHLGGGTTSDPENSLYRFKRSFSHLENDFYIGKWIFDEDAYEKTAARWETEKPDLIPLFGNRLLKYRYSHKDL